MPLTLKNSSTMTADEMAPHWPDIFECLGKYCRRFDDETVPNIIRECFEGKRTLWLVFDETGRVILAPITEIVTVNATGERRLALAEVGGTRLKESMSLLREIEEWAAREHGAVKVGIVARKGWKPLLEPLGYKAKAVLWQKEL